MKNLQIHPRDNVLIALTDGKAKEVMGDVILKQEILAGHKVAMHDIKRKEAIIKYGEPIAHATTDIRQGEWIHTHNIKTNLSGKKTYTYEPVPLNSILQTPKRDITGYRRSNGKVGIRNELWVINTVGCINSIAANIVTTFQQEVHPADIDGVYSFHHPYGCSQMGEDQAHTIQILRDIVMHPNAGGVLVLGLGCENNQRKSMRSCVMTSVLQLIIRTSPSV